MKNLKILFVSILFVSVSSCCGQQKAPEASKDQTLAAEPQQVAPETSKMSRLSESHEYIFSSETKASKDQLSSIFSESGVVEVRSLGGEQYFLKFSSAKSEPELQAVLKKNGLSGAVSRNLRYQAPPPVGGKYPLKDKLKQ